MRVVFVNGLFLFHHRLERPRSFRAKQSPGFLKTRAAPFPVTSTGLYLGQNEGYSMVSTGRSLWR